MSKQGSESTQNKRRFLARYGAIILRGGIATIPAALYRYQGELKLKPLHVWFISAILAHKWDDDMPHPSLRKMAPLVGMSERHLHTLKKELVDAGHLVVINRANNVGGKASNYFDFSPLLGQLEELLKRDKPRPEDEASNPDDEEPDGWSDDDAADEGSSGGYMNPSSDGYMNPSSDGYMNPSSEHFVEAYIPEALTPESSLNSKDKYSNSFNSKGNSAKLSTALRGQSTVDNPTMAPLRSAPVPESTTNGRAKAAAVAQRLRSHDTAPEGSQEPGRRGRRRVGEPPPQLLVAMEEASSKLNDEHPNSSLTRAMTLVEQSGLPTSRFCQEVYEAVAAVRQAKVRKPSKYGQGVMNRMPLFFAELERVLGFRDREDWSKRYVAPGS
jgi:hypothetical protein